MDKVCIRCKKKLNINIFRLLPEVVLASGKTMRYASNVCTPCIVSDNKQRRTRKQKDSYNTKKKIERQARKIRAIKYKGGKCSICGGIFHQASYDFHHINPEDKRCDPGLMMQLSDDVLFKELDKCILICANCHRVLHYKEGTLGRRKI